MTAIVLFIVIIISFSTKTFCKKFGKCELAFELKRQGFPRDQLPDWVCLVNSESSMITDQVGTKNRDGSQDHGLFQINDRYWCDRDGWSRQACGIGCHELRKDDITYASTCAKKIYSIHGFDAWVGWRHSCKAKPLPSLQDCGRL